MSDATSPAHPSIEVKPSCDFGEITSAKRQILRRETRKLSSEPCQSFLEEKTALLHE